MEVLFYLLPRIFPDFMGIMTVIVVSSAITILLVALLLYGAHKVSSENNMMDYVYIKVTHCVLI